MAIVRWCLDPSVIAGLEYEDFVRRVAPDARGSSYKQERLRAVWEKAVDSIGCRAGESLDVEAKLMVEGMAYVRESIREVEENIEEMCSCFPEYRCLLSIPGFGPDICSQVIAAIGNPFRFDNQRQILKMAGMDLSANRSGTTSDKAIPRLSKNGNAYLRYALYQASMIASYRNTPFIRYVTEKLRGREKEKGIKTKMRVKLAAKMLIIAWTLMKKREAFDPKYLAID